MTREEIDDVVVAIMINDGPDHHCDGHEVISDFICALLEGRDNEWIQCYNDENARKVAQTAYNKLPEKLAKMTGFFNDLNNKINR